MINLNISSMDLGLISIIIQEVLEQKIYKPEVEKNLKSINFYLIECLKDLNLSEAISKKNTLDNLKSEIAEALYWQYDSICQKGGEKLMTFKNIVFGILPDDKDKLKNILESLGYK